MNRRAARSNILGAALSASLLGAVGCSDPGGQEDPVDAGSSPGQDGGGQDAAPASGLTIRFVYLGPDGELVAGDDPIRFADFSIKEMTMQLHRMEVIGDNAPGGKLIDRTSLLEFPWDDPPQVSFLAAPQGLYSWLDYKIERTYATEPIPEGFKNRRLSIRVQGEVDISGEHDFVYADGETVEVALNIDEVVDNRAGEVVIALDLMRWFDVVDWQALVDQLENGDGGSGGDDDGEEDAGGDDDDEIKIGIDGDQATAASMRERLRSSFVVFADD